MDVAFDEGMTRRLKALAVTAPMHDLDSRKNLLDFADASDYQMAEIAFHIIDQVTLAMDFDRGASHADVVKKSIPFIARQASDQSIVEHERVATWVLEELLNVGSQVRGFTAFYGTFDAEGSYQKRKWTFKLLEEFFEHDGEVFLRSTDMAINVLVGALDMDVESAQEAAETKLHNLIKRGRLSDARLVADQALRLTIQLGERLRQKLEMTRRDVRSVDWMEEMPVLLDEALTHIEQRLRTETAILENLTQTRDQADDPTPKRQAAQLVDLVAECIRKHNQLQARLQTAGETFRSEQDRQQFSGATYRSTIDLFGQLLVPVLGLPISSAEAPTTVFFRSSVGLSVQPVLRLMDLVYTLLTPPVERDDLSGELPDLELAPAEDPAVFSDEVWAESDALLELDGAPRRLSGLLIDAREKDPALPHLVGLLAINAVDPAISTAIAHDKPWVLIAIDDGTPLDDVEFGGTDLLVVRAQIDRDRPDHSEPADTDVGTAAGLIEVGGVG